MAIEDGRAGRPASTGRTFRLLRLAIGYLLALGCLIWIFHDVRPAALLADMRAIRWGWVVPAILLDIASYFCQGLRWELLLRPFAALSPLRATQAVYAGLFTNEIFPMRFGEIVRAYLVSRWTGMDLVRVIPSMAAERLFDGVWLAIGIGLAAVFVPLPRELAAAGDLLGIAVLLAVVLFAVLVLRAGAGAGARTADGHRAGAGAGITATPAAVPDPEGSSPVGVLRRARAALRSFGGILRAMGRTRHFYQSFGVSPFILVFQMIAFWLIMRAYGLALPFPAGAIVLLIVHLGTALPNAPGNIGTYQFFCIVGLALFHVEKTTATGFSLAVFVLLTVPLWALGSLALARSGVSLESVRMEAWRRKLR